MAKKLRSAMQRSKEEAQGISYIRAPKAKFLKFCLAAAGIAVVLTGVVASQFDPSYSMGALAIGVGIIFSGVALEKKVNARESLFKDHVRFFSDGKKLMAELASFDAAARKAHASGQQETERFDYVPVPSSDQQ